MRSAFLQHRSPSSIRTDRPSVHGNDAKEVEKVTEKLRKILMVLTPVAVFVLAAAPRLRT